MRPVLPAFIALLLALLESADHEGEFCQQPIRDGQPELPWARLLSEPSWGWPHITPRSLLPT